MKINTINTLFIIVMAVGFTLSSTFAGDIKAFEATFEEVREACDNTEGCELTIFPNGSFDANTDDTTIQCTGLGMCIGWTNDEARRSPAVANWNKTTQTTFVGVMSKQFRKSKHRASCPNVMGRVRSLDRKSQMLLTKIRKLSPTSKFTAVKSLIRRSRMAKSIRSSKLTKLKWKVRAKMLARQRHMTSLIGQLKRNTKQRKNLWRQCKAKVGQTRSMKNTSISK